MAGAGALHVSRAPKDTYNRGGTWDSRHFHPATAILPTRLGHDASTARRRRGPTAPQVLEFLRRERNVPGIQPYLVQDLGIHWTPSGPATDPGLVGDRGRRVNAPVSPAHPQGESRAFRCAEQRRVSAWTPARTCARRVPRRPDAGGRSWFRGPGSSRATGRSSPAAGPGRTAR